jgi:hypothetical protein
MRVYVPDCPKGFEYCPVNRGRCVSCDRVITIKAGTLATNHAQNTHELATGDRRTQKVNR